MYQLAASGEPFVSPSYIKWRGGKLTQSPSIISPNVASYRCVELSKFPSNKTKRLPMGEHTILHKKHPFCYGDSSFFFFPAL